MADEEMKSEEAAQAESETTAANEPEVVTPAEQIQRGQRKAAREAAQSESGHVHDELQPGGGYIVDGVLQDSEGNPVKGK